MGEESVVNKEQEAMISDIVGDFMPSAAAAVETQTQTQTQEEAQTDGNQGQERAEEAAGGQEQTAGTGAEEGQEEVVAQVTEETGQVPPTQGQVQAESGQPPVTQTQTQTQGEDEVSRLQKELNEMRLLLAEVTGRVSQPQQQQPTQQQTQTQDAQGRQILRFLQNDEAYDEVTKNADNFNVLLTTVVNTAVERSLKMIPQVATNLVDNQLNLRTYVDEFYRANEDLIPYRKYVGFVTNEVAAEHPDWKLEQLLAETETRSRTLLKLPKGQSGQGQVVQSAQRTVTTAQAPAFVPGRQGGRRGSAGAETMTGQDKQIMDLLS